MRRTEELMEEIRKVRTELEDALLQKQDFEEYYEKSKILDQLIDEYMELENQKKERIEE